MQFRTDSKPTLSSSAPTSTDATTARAIAKEAYTYGFPLVDSYRILYSYFVDRSSPEYKAGWNEKVYNNTRVFTPDDKAMQTPNSDTPYSQLGLDLRTEPMVLSVPAVEKGRYYSVEINDLYTFISGYIGTRTTGNDAGDFLIAGPGWKGEKPPGIKAVIPCETQLAFIFYRTQLFRPDDIENVKKVQAGYKVQPLSTFLGQPAPTAAPKIDFFKPISAEDERTSLQFFNVLNFVLRFCPTHPSETDLRARFAKIGVGENQNFNVDSLSPEFRKAIEDGRADAWQDFDKLGKRVEAGEVTSGDELGSRAFLKDNYLYRMRGTVAGIWGNAKEEAIYPAYYLDSTGKQVDGASNRYTLRLTADNMPPTNSFWSLTMYNLPARLLVANPINRYLINSPMLPDLKRDADGGLTLYIQRGSPGKDKESNWLPAPNGPFVMALRLYVPKPEALDGRWKQPPLQRQPESDKQVPISAGGEKSLDSRPTTPAPVPVTADNFNRAESDMYFAGVVKQGAFGKFHHIREPLSIDNQTVIRGNRDTLYSSGVFDLDAGSVTVTLPDPRGRFMSLIVLDEDQYALATVYAPGSFTYTKQQVGTRYVLIGLRTFVDPTDSADLDRVHALQDAVKSEQKSIGSFEVPNWDAASQKKVRDALIILAGTIPDTRGMFGPIDRVDPVRHLIGSATGWGGNAPEDATYLTVVPQQNDGKTVHRLTIKGEVPVDGFWSISVYGADGYFHKNERDAYTLNNLTAKKSPDGSVTIQFGGCDGRVTNCLPIEPGWNYWVRLYRPRAEVLNGSYVFPEPQPVTEKTSAAPVRDAQKGTQSQAQL